MLRILDRYIFREIAQTWLAVTMVLLFILLTNQFARVLGDVAKDKLPKDAIFQIIGLTGLQYMTILVPIGLFLSVMLALGRLYRDSEMPAIERIGMEARRQADLASIEPGRFTSDKSGGAVVYAEKVLGPGTVENVFLQRRGDGGGVEVVIAERGEQRDSDDPNTRYFILFDGRRYDGVPGTSSFRVMEFAEHGIPYRLPGVEDPELEPRAMQTAGLITSSDPAHVAELHWRIGVPLATLVLALIAVPLSRSQPRQGRYGRLAIGLLVFIIYFNLLTAGKAWLEQSTVPGSVGLWWVHALMLSFALAMLGVQNGIHRRVFSLGAG
jgi:lipopolysaccharide export system permease protein